MKTEKVRNFLPLAGLLIVFIAFAVLSGGRNLTSSNLQSIFNQSFFTMLAGICATFVYAHGGIDLSIGGLEGICMLIAVVSMRNIGFVPALFLVVLTGIVSGILIGGYFRIWKYSGIYHRPEPAVYLPWNFEGCNLQGTDNSTQPVYVAGQLGSEGRCSGGRGSRCGISF